MDWIDQQITVYVRYPHGVTQRRAFFWQSDESIIRDAIKALEPFAPKPSECTVDRCRP